MIIVHKYDYFSNINLSLTYLAKLYRWQFWVIYITNLSGVNLRIVNLLTADVSVSPILFQLWAQWVREEAGKMARLISVTP